VHGGYVQCRFVRPNAQAVHLVGAFNGWREDQLRMIPDGGGCRLAVIRLPPGAPAGLDTPRWVRCQRERAA
jgi:hypothetical protein